MLMIEVQLLKCRDVDADGIYENFFWQGFRYVLYNLHAVSMISGSRRLTLTPLLEESHTGVNAG